MKNHYIHILMRLKESLTIINQFYNILKVFMKTTTPYLNGFSPAYRHLIVDSLNFCIANKGFKVYCWPAIGYRGE